MIHTDDGQRNVAAHFRTICEYAEKLNAGEDEPCDDEGVRIDDYPLCIEYRSEWSTSPDSLTPSEYRITLTFGGPTLYIEGEMGLHGEPDNASLVYFDDDGRRREYWSNDPAQESILCRFVAYFVRVGDL